MDYTHANETTPGKYISISRDKTIRLWECSGAFDQIYEFSSPNDQALCVAAHPTEQLFACGFESGIVRIFDIEKTNVREDYN